MKTVRKFYNFNLEKIGCLKVGYEETGETQQEIPENTLSGVDKENEVMFCCTYSITGHAWEK